MVELITSVRIAGTFQAQPSLNTKDAEVLLDQGCSRQSLEHPTPLRTGYCAWIDAETFAFEQHLNVELEIERLILILVADLEHCAVDIAAINPLTGRVGTWCHRAWAIGEGTTFLPRLTERRVLTVWRNPVGWLRAGRSGVVLLQPRLAAAFLCDAGPLAAEDRDHGFELRRQLTRPAPHILIPAAMTRSVA
jgi:hypothetical protein